MTAQRWSVPVGVLVLVWIAPGGVAAQGVARSDVAAQATVTIERPAQIVRMQIDLAGKHKEPKEALAKLKQLRESAGAKVIELGAVKDSIKFGEPFLGTLGTSPDADMQRMVMLRVQGKQVDEAALKALPLVATIRLTAEWPLVGDNSEERLLYGHELKEKIKAADLAGSKDGPALTAEEQELKEELDSAPSFGMPQPSKPGEPSFVFVARIPEEERAKALADAFAKARAQAARLAHAAGMQVGSLRSLSGNLGPVETDQQYDYYSRVVAAMGGRIESAAGEENAEAVGPQPGRVEYRVTVSASFELIPQ